MKKRFNLVFVLLLGVIMLLTMAACNRNKSKEELPNNVGGNTQQPPAETELSASLDIKVKDLASSIFNSIYIDQFKLDEYVTYSVVYKDKEGSIVRVIPGGGVQQEMVDEKDLPKLSQPGHHIIKITADIGNDRTASGSFELHLKDRSGSITLIDYTFNLLDQTSGAKAQAFFGKVTDDQLHTVVSVEKGAKVASWSEFINAFPMRLRLEDKTLALASFVADNGDVIDENYNFPYTFSEKRTFAPQWTEDRVNITFDIRKPQDATTLENKPDPSELFVDNGKYANMTARKNVGRIEQPLDDDINIYAGYYFAGWFNKADDTVWRFTSPVGNYDIELYAKWIATEYSFTIYLMGGTFTSNIAPAKHIEDNKSTIITAENAEDLGYSIVSSESRFSLSTGELNRIAFNGFHYGVSYDKYVSEVQINQDGQKVMLKFSDFYSPAKSNIFQKGSGDVLKIDDLYYDFQCTRKLKRNDNVDFEQPVTYIKWVFNEPDKNDENYDELYLERISKLYTEILFPGENAIVVLADGSVKLDKLTDYAVNELIVPAQLFVKGQVRNVSEIGEYALSNVNSLTKIDLTKATNLTTIGTRAFALASNLKEIIMPEDCAIVTIGDNAFIGTDFENNYYKNTNGSEFIIINKKIYKYVGADKEVIDISNPMGYYTEQNAPEMSVQQRQKYNKELAAVTSIGDGAFEDCKSLKEFKLSSQIASIENYAFSGLNEFVNLVLPDDSALTAIGENAFADSALLGTASAMYNEELGSLIIGGIYYRMIDKSRTAATIPARNGNFAVISIASKAFDGCAQIADVTFEDESLITSIGADAFLNTEYVQLEKQGDAFTSVNHILTSYYAPVKNSLRDNIIVPDRVDTIASNAFGQYAQYFVTVQINSNVQKIESNAFSGASMMQSVIFPDILADDENNTLINAPTVSETAFANTNGEMRDDVLLFFNESVIKLFTKLATDNDAAANVDETTRAWLNLYLSHMDNFMAEDIKTVAIDRSRVASKLMQKVADVKNPSTDNDAEAQADGNEEETEVSLNDGEKAFLALYGDETQKEAIIDDALIITSNTGVARTASLSWTANTIKLVKAEKDGEYESLLKDDDGNVRKDVKIYVLTYSYNGSDKGCAVDVGDKNLFVITLYEAVAKAQDDENDEEDVPAFYSSENYKQNGTAISANGKNQENSKIWLEGLDGQVQGAVLPTYYTSCEDITEEICMGYKDINGKVKRIYNPTIKGFRTNATATGVTATFTFNFNGLGTYVFSYKYSVVISKYTSIEQTGAVIIPINGGATEYLTRYKVDLVGQDKKRTSVSLNTFTVESVDGQTGRPINTTTLGMHTMCIKYSNNDAEKTLRRNVYYTVVLQSDSSQFEYEPIDRAAKTALIYKCNLPDTAVNIVVPSTCEIDGEQYDIVQIGHFQFVNGESNISKGVFENYKSLRAVYLPDTIQRLGVNTFAGCVRLTNVYTSIQSTETPIVIKKDKFDDVFEQFGESNRVSDDKGVTWTVYPVKLVSLEGLEYEGDLIIDRDYEDPENHIIYRVVSVKDGLKVNKTDKEIDVYLPDTIYTEVNVLDDKGEAFAANSIFFFAGGSNFMFKTKDIMPSGLLEIGNGVFSNCEQLQSIRLDGSTKLQMLGANVFMGSGFRSIDFSKNTALKYIGDMLFKDCSALERVVLHDGIERIGKLAFDNCGSLQSITGWGEKLVRIGDNAFSRCSSLTFIDLYNGVKTMGTNVFSACSALTILCHFDESHLQTNSKTWNTNWNGSSCPIVWDADENNIATDGLLYVVQDGIRYALNLDTNEATVAGQMSTLKGNTYVVDFDGNVTTEIEKGIIVLAATIKVTVGEEEMEFTVTTIGKNAFAYNTEITRITVTKQLKVIEQYAFRGCSSLTQFIFEDSNGLTSVSTTAFTGCSDTLQRPTVDVQLSNE